MARPRSDPTGARNCTTTAHFTQEEHDALCAHLARRGIRASHFVRELVLREIGRPVDGDGPDVVKVPILERSSRSSAA